MGTKPEDEDRVRDMLQARPTRLTSTIIDEAVKLLSPASYERTQILNLPQRIRQAGGLNFTSMSQARAGCPIQDVQERNQPSNGSTRRCRGHS
jgi:hypothetical protein